MPGKVHGQRRLAGCSPWGNMTEHACLRVNGDGLIAINCRTRKKKKGLQTINAGEGVEKRKRSCTVGGNVN